MAKIRVSKNLLKETSIRIDPEKLQLLREKGGNLSEICRAAVDRFLEIDDTSDLAVLKKELDETEDEINQQQLKRNILAKQIKDLENQYVREGIETAEKDRQYNIILKAALKQIPTIYKNMSPVVGGSNKWSFGESHMSISTLSRMDPRIASDDIVEFLEPYKKNRKRPPEEEITAFVDSKIKV